MHPAVGLTMGENKRRSRNGPPKEVTIPGEWTQLGDEPSSVSALGVEDGNDLQG